MIAIIPIPAFADNYIWLMRQGTTAVVVDPGDAAPVLAYLAREALTLTAILATHHHGDHVGGNTALLAQFPVPVFGPRAGNDSRPDAGGRRPRHRQCPRPARYVDRVRHSRPYGGTYCLLRRHRPTTIAFFAATRCSPRDADVETFAVLRAWKNAL